ncbi:putative dehydrogenase [Kribbella voronezhensis]|uniref:Putative dehydrogenase n=1 Tax=Kribbella voronezhensis TaxID=2512212 RepID=A0A4R7T5Y1_9ACTN|nr:Gfo/Idh/MocA family oxidoreductase [Kribbella voronezhensis]TDU87204.1 putative dehydrogenase [Kribbella voronezhensis]
MSETIRRVAIVGTGGIATAHAQAVATQPDRARLVAAVDVDLGRAEAFAKTWDVPAAYPSLAALLAAGDVDLVLLCTPPGSHVPLAAECLAAGVDVLVEKPPTLSLNELDELLELESRSTARVICVFQHRFGSGAVRLRRLAADGLLGRPLVATCHTLWYRDDAYFAVPWRGTFEIEGGGPTMGHGIHQFDLLLSILGPWEQVTAVAARQARPTQTEDVSLALVTFANGAVASIVNSLVSARETSTLRFDYEHASVELEHLYGYTDADWTVTPAPGQEAVADAWSADAADIPSGHSAQFAAVLDAKDAGRTAPVSLADARDTMELIAAIYASAFTGKPVRRGELDAANPFSVRMDGTGAPWAT